MADQEPRIRVTVLYRTLNTDTIYIHQPNNDEVTGKHRLKISATEERLQEL